MTHNEENTQLIKTDPELTHMLEWKDKTIKSVIVTIYVWNIK